MKLADDTVPRWSKIATGLLVLGLLISTFAFARKAAHEQHRRAVAQEAQTKAEEQRTQDNRAALEAQARSLTDFDSVLGQLQAAGISPVVTHEQAAQDARITPVAATTTTTVSRATPATQPSRPPSSTTTTTTTTPTTTTTQPPPPPPRQTCVTTPMIGPLPTVGTCVG